MRNYFYAASARRLMLTAAAVLILVFCVGVVSYAQVTVSGTVTRAGLPCADARVVITTDDATYYTGKTGTDGTYTISSVPAGTYKFLFNAVNAVPQIISDVEIGASAVTQNVALQFGYTPIIEDFTASDIIYDGTINPTGQWNYFNAAVGVPTVDLTDTSATTTDGILQLSPFPYRGGVISRASYPTYLTSFEFVLPRQYTGVSNTSAYQVFALIRDADSGFANEIEVRDYASSTAAYIRPNVYIGDTSSSNVGQTTINYSDHTKVKLLLTGNRYDIFINNVWMDDEPLTYVPNPAYIYLYGYEGQTAATPTTAYFDNIGAGTVVPVTPITLDAAKSAATGTTVAITDAVVTASIPTAFWIENTDRSAGIKVISSVKPAFGKKVSVFGTIVRNNNEVVLDAQDVVIGQTTAVWPAPVGITGKVAAELDKAGATAQGLLVKVAGKVTDVVPDNTNTYILGYYLDDGSGLPGDGAGHKGIFVKVDSSFNLPIGVINVGDFRTRTGPLSVDIEQTGSPIPAVIAFEGPDEYPDEFIAYNDCAWTSSQATSSNATLYTITAGQTTGYLKDVNTGKYVPAMVTITGSNVSLTTSTGSTCYDGDAYTYFNGKVDLTGYIGRSANSWWVDVKFSGLSTDPRYAYVFVATANRNYNSTTKYNTNYVLSGVSASTYAFSSGTTKSNDLNGYFNTYYNTYNGYVAKWTGIQPAADGTFTVRARYNTSSQTQGFAISGFMLQRVKL